MADTYDMLGNLNPDAPWAEMLSEDTQLPLWDGEVPGFEQAIGQRRPSITFFPRARRWKTWLCDCNGWRLLYEQSCARGESGGAEDQ